MKNIILLSCLLILLPLSVLASTINVPTTENPTIQAGIDASVDGDTVLLADGTYTGAGNYNIDFSGKSITVKSSGGADVCVVDCEGNGRGFLAYSGETVTFEGLTVKNADAGDGNNGGGVYANESEIIIVDCSFTENQASHGGAVYSSSSSSSSSSFTNCEFTANKGGAVNCSYSSSSFPSNFSSFSNCTFSANEGRAAVYSNYSHSSFTNCTFTDNVSGAVSSSCSSSFDNCAFINNSAKSGGAVSFHSSYDHSPSFFNNCTFTSNSASYGGGAVCYTGALTSWYSPSSFTNCTFTNNFAIYGGAMVTFVGSSCTNCTFTSNSASQNGGAVNSSGTSFNNCTFTSNSASNGGSVSYSSYYSSSFTNCAFTLNEAAEQGGAMWCNIPLAPEDPITLKNCILWGNTAPEGAEIYEAEGSKPLIITCSNIQGGHTGLGNINEDPLFIDTFNDDFHLQLASPCIDTGTADGAPSDDLDGNYRPVGSGYDMGAYEYQGPIVIDSFTANPTTGQPSLTVNFTCTAHDDVNAITGYQWNFGDGNTDTTLTGTTQHTYIIPGTFTATCTVINDNADQTTVSTTIEVTNDDPVADAGPDQIIPGSTVDLDGSVSNDPDGTISSWEWTLTHTENSAYNKSVSGEIVYLSDLAYGHYTVLLTVVDNFGAQGVDEMFLSIAGSTGDVYSQEDLDNVRQDGYDQGYLEGMDEGLNNSGNTIVGIIVEGANGEKVIEGPVIIKGTLVIE